MISVIVLAHLLTWIWKIVLEYKNIYCICSILRVRTWRRQHPIICDSIEPDETCQMIRASTLAHNFTWICKENTHIWVYPSDFEHIIVRKVIPVRPNHTSFDRNRWELSISVCNNLGTYFYKNSKGKFSDTCTATEILIRFTLKSHINNTQSLLIP
jgi:hypothetical protein